MDVKILKKSDRRIKFILSDVDVGLANALRRIAKNEIPVMAIEEVNFEQNSSDAFGDKFLKIGCQLYRPAIRRVLYL